MLAVIGGTGLGQLEGLETERRESVATTWGEPSAPLEYGRYHGQSVIFLARHGMHHRLAPHEINYRANIDALCQAGVREIVAVAAVGGIEPRLAPGTLAVPEQLIDYTWGRGQSFSVPGEVIHADMTRPYSASLRGRLLEAATGAGVEVVDGGVYGATQGPRLETAAEVDRLERDGCTMVGMTGMPEAALARERGLDYACLAVSVNHAAGRGGAGEDIHASIEGSLAQGMAQVRAVLAALMSGPPA